MTHHRPNHPKPDANQAQNEADLRKCGLLVINVSDLPGRQADDDTDTLDAFVADPQVGYWVHVEWKVPGGKLTERQRRYVERWAGIVPILVAETWEDVLAYFGRDVVNVVGIEEG